MASRTGYSASLYVGTYQGAEITDVTATLSHEPVDVSDLASTWRERQAGLLDWEITGRKNYATQAFLGLAMSGTTSMVVKLYDMTSTVVFSACGYVTRGLAAMPAGAANEEITVVCAVSTVATN